MNAVVLKSRRFLREEDGVTAVEYALIAALIAVVIIGGATAIGLNVNGVLQNIAGVLPNA